MKQLNWWKSIASFLVVLFTMPLGHADDGDGTLHLLNQKRM